MVMPIKWQQVQNKYLRLFLWMIVAKRYRTKTGVLLVMFCAFHFYTSSQSPFDLTALNVWVALGLLLIALGPGQSDDVRTVDLCPIPEFLKGCWLPAP